MIGIYYQCVLTFIEDDDFQTTYIGNLQDTWNSACNEMNKHVDDNEHEYKLFSIYKYNTLINTKEIVISVDNLMTINNYQDSTEYRRPLKRVRHNSE